MACAPTINFTDPRALAATAFPNSRVEDDQLYFEPEISPEHCFEGIIGNSPALRKVLEHVAIVDVLTNCPWKGNIRELANFIERAVIVTQGEELDVPIATLPSSADNVVAVNLPSSFREAESNVIIDALRAAAGRIAGAAERLGLKRTTLQNKIRRLGITKAQYQN